MPLSAPAFRFRGTIAVLVFWALGFALLISPARGQSGPALLLKPWEEDQRLEASADALFLQNGDLEGTNSSFQLHTYESTGRLRLFPGNIASPRIGYDVTWLDIQSNDPRLPRRLADQAVGAGFALAQLESGWIAGMTVGVGFAGETMFDDANAWYGKSTLIFGREMGEKSQLVLALDYDGNRIMLPDVPLPGVAYTFAWPQRELSFVVGFPVNALIWEPSENWKIEFTFTVLDRLDARIGYKLSSDWTLFGRFETRDTAFHTAELESTNDRLFFEQRRVEAGLLWSPRPEVSLLVAAGYAFEQRFSVGWDTRDRDGLVDPSDEPYVRAGVEVRF